MAWAFLVGILVLPVAEIMVWIRVAESIGGLATVGLTLLAVLAGAALIQRGGLGMALEVRARMERGEAPGPALFDGVCVTLAGLLLMLPGFITDAIALLLLLPVARSLLLRLVTARVVVGGSDFSPPSSGPTVIDGEYEIIPPESGPADPAQHKRLEP